MKRSYLLLALVFCLTLTGCSWFDGSYVSVTPHWESHQAVQTDTLSARDYPSLMDALQEMVYKAAESAPIIVVDYTMGSVERGMASAIEYVKNIDPIGAYAVEDITYELGTSGGLPALAVNISYRHSLAEIQRIRTVNNVSQAQTLVAEALESYATSVVIHVKNYTEKDFAQMVQDYAEKHPETVMETPQVTEILYGNGRPKVLELIFSYQTSRDALRKMQEQVGPVFESALLYVRGDGSQLQKYGQLFGFLMERFDYTLETSITPAYSLLCHGVGDSRAFASAYAAMCRRAGLDCIIVTGTRGGEPYTWNMVLDNGQYYHVDLLRSHGLGQFRLFRDWEMAGYVWDYSAYPACGGQQPPAETPEEEQEDAEVSTEETTEELATEETMMETSDTTEK